MSIDWASVQALYSPDVATHWARSQELGLQCPLDAFEQLFFDHHTDDEFAAVVSAIDWKKAEWLHAEWTGAALRRVAVPRSYQHALDEARWRTLEHGLEDERWEVIERWRVAGTWIRSPILIAGELMGSSLGVECLVGFTRLGNLLGLLDRQEIPESATHRVWLGTCRSDSIGADDDGDGR